MRTKCLAQVLAAIGIRINAIGPGFIETPMTAATRQDEARSRRALSVTPMGRYGRPDEIAATALVPRLRRRVVFHGRAVAPPSGGVFVG
jgi:NAD(P)-dependent dehydrogenase (short-subunit alcohol dehydrogenase family)